MDYDIEINLISQEFVNKYPTTLFPELMCKEVRPYSCLLIDTHSDYFICIPFRSHINHSNAYMFKNSKRSKVKKSGLDYSKVILIKDSRFIGQKAIVDKDEYVETIQNLQTIVYEITTYIDEYVKCNTNEITIAPEQFRRKYQFTSLKYFHDILGINS